MPTGTPCPDSDFTCYTLTVPLNHFDPANPQTIEVVFGLRPADGERQGMLVIATGGPGSSGLAVADSYAAGYAPAILEHFDLVFFDQRGVGASGGLTCPQAVADYYQTETDTQTPAGEATAIAPAEIFAAACVSQLDQPDLLPYLTTRQAVAEPPFVFDIIQQIPGQKKLLDQLFRGKLLIHFCTVSHPISGCQLLLSRYIKSYNRVTFRKSITFLTIMPVSQQE